MSDSSVDGYYKKVLLKMLISARILHSVFPYSERGLQSFQMIRGQWTFCSTASTAPCIQYFSCQHSDSGLTEVSPNSSQW